MKRLLLIISAAFVCIGLSASSVDFDYVRKLALSGTTVVTETLVIEGYAIAGGWNENSVPNEQVYFNAVTIAPMMHAGYIQSVDGRFGFRLEYESDAFARSIKRYSKLQIDLCGCTLSVKDGCFAVSGIKEGNVSVIAAPDETAVVKKEKYIRELTEEDIYTFVTLKDCEFVFKDGAYINIYEPYARHSVVNAKYNPNSFMDGWASLLCDSNSDHIYMSVNSRCDWRRRGSGVPKGSGTVSGIIDRSENIRYGSLGKYQIRPLDDTAFSMSSPSNWKTLAQWNWNDMQQQFKTPSGKVERVTSEHILSDIGKAELYVDFPAEIVRGRDFNNPVAENSKTIVRGDKGIVQNGAMQIRAKACDWWNWGDDFGNSVVLELSTSSIQANSMALAFTFCGGNITAETSRHFPVYWNVEVSVDDQTYVSLDDSDAVMRSLPWWWQNPPVDGLRRNTSWEAGLGMTDHMYVLPPTLAGQEKIYVRISPSRKIAATLAKTNTDKAALRSNLNTMTYVNFGTITIMYR